MKNQPNPFEVVLAEPKDIAELFVVCKRLWSENALWQLDEEKAWKEMELALSRKSFTPSVIGLIRNEKTNAIEGVAWIDLVTPWYSQMRYWAERLIFVIPECRRTTHAKRLIGYCKWISDCMTEALKDKPNAQQASVPVVIGVMTQKNLEGKIRLYQRQLPQLGAFFVHGWTSENLYNQRHLPKGN